MARRGGDLMAVAKAGGSEASEDGGRYWMFASTIAGFPVVVQ